jgi:hypothetical protein
MTKDFTSLSSGRLLTIALGVGALAISACGGAATAPKLQSALAAPLTSSPTPTPFPFAFQTPIVCPSALDTQVTGIDDNSEIVGTYGSSRYSSRSSGSLSSFVSNSPYSSCLHRDYNRATSTVLRAITVASSPYAGNTEEAGWLVDPHGLANGYFGAIDDAGNWFVMKHDPTCSTSYAGIYTWIYGINTYGIASGSYKTGSSCTQHGFLFSPTEGYSTPGPQPSSIITGIDKEDDIVGTQTTSSGQESWYALCKSYTSGTAANGCAKYYAAETVSSTAGPIVLSGIVPWGTNGIRLAVGTLGSGAGSKGVILTLTGYNTYSVLQTVTVGSVLTVLTGINDNYDICGWYENSANNGYKGFVGTP